MFENGAWHHVFCGLLRFLEMERVIPDTLKRLLEDANLPTLQPKLFTAKLGQAAGKKCCLFPGAEIAVAAHRLHLSGQQEGCTQPFFGLLGFAGGFGLLRVYLTVGFGGVSA